MSRRRLAVLVALACPRSRSPPTPKTRIAPTNAKAASIVLKLNRLRRAGSGLAADDSDETRPGYDPVDLLT